MRGREIVLAILSLFSLVAVSTAGHAESAAEQLIPEGFDPGSEYTTYSYDELRQHIEKTLGITNKFEGEKVKVFGKFYTNYEDGLNKTHFLMPALAGNYGCVDRMCEQIEMMITEDPSTIIKTATIGLPYLYFPARDQYAQLRANLDHHCGELHLCYICAEGTLHVKDVGSRTIWGVSKLDLPYLEVEKVVVFEAPTTAYLKHTFTDLFVGAKALYQIYQYLP